MCNVGTLIRFLTRARQNLSYETINQINEQTLDDGSKLIGPYSDYYKGVKYQYLDKYKTYDFEEFEGREIILVNEKEQWFRYYHGFFVDKNFVEKSKEVFDFLKIALKEFPINNPQKRGIKKIEINDYLYTDYCEDSFENFKGEEKIFFKGKLIYQLEYFGGIKA